MQKRRGCRWRSQGRHIFIAVLSVLVWNLTVPQPVFAQSRLENPGPNSTQSGIGVISGWKCTAGTITARFDNLPDQQVAYGLSRGDTQTVCNDTNNGFGLLVNWNLAGDGQHTLTLFDNGAQFATATFTVQTLGTQFLTGASGTYTLDEFPQTGRQVTIQWQESLQNFVITKTGETCSNLITIFEQTNFQGGSLVLNTSATPPPGSPSITDFAQNANNIAACNNSWDNCASSIRVPPGCQVRICENNAATANAGICVTLTDDVPDLSVFRGTCSTAGITSLNNCISSLSATAL